MSAAARAGLRLLERIGSGGSSEVWRARWDGSDGAVAVKVLRPQAARPVDARAAPDARARLLREGRLLRRYPHPGLLRCLAVDDGSPPLLILEHPGGETLAQRLQRGPLPEPEVAHIAAAVLRALLHLHDVGVLHRDVSPANLLLAPDGVRLLDLGRASDPADPFASTLGDAHGTLAYAAPELRAGARADGRADLYALGRTLHHALTGRPPDAAPLPATPGAPGLDRLLARLQAGDAAARPASAAVALAMLLAGPVTPRRLDAPATPVGREAVCAALRDALDAGGGVVTLSGGAGDGLRAAMAWARALAGARGVDAVDVPARGRGLRADAAEALTVWVGAVRPAEVVPALRALAAEAAGAPRLVLTVAGAAEPLAGEAAALVAEVPGLVVVLPGAGGVPLRRLDGDEIAALVAAMLGGPAPEGVAAAVACDGRAGDAVRALRRLARAGALTCTGVDAEGRARWRFDGHPAERAGDAAERSGDAAQEAPSPWFAHGALRGDAVRAAFHAGMAGAGTGDDAALERAIAALQHAPEPDAARALRARAGLLYARSVRTRAATHHAEALDAARAAGSPQVRVVALHALGTPAARREAAAVVREALNGMDEPLRADFLALPSVRWARRPIGSDKR